LNATAPAFDGRARLIAAAVLCLVVTVAIFQQAVARDLRFATQFAEVPRRLPLALAVLFPIGSVVSQLVVYTRLARALERRKMGAALAALVTLLAGAAICIAFNLASALAARTFGHDTPRLLVKGLVGGIEVYGLWLLALKYPKLVEDVRVQALEIDRVRQAAEIAQLREHLQPHFLRNTLNAVAALVSEDPSEARNLLAALADLLSDSIENSAPQRSLGAEIAWLRRYAEILEVRYRGSLRFEWDEEPTAAETLVPRLLLQPLVENAVHHGALACAADGRVTVRTRVARGGGTRVEVEDNGPGFDPTTSKEGVGLTLVRSRVAAEAHGTFAIEHGPYGTRAVVELP
jgi:two-component sensor histidine kinase